jgi:carboxymethylenebutenolidase
MQSATVEVRTPDGTADAYLTRPEGDDELPGVLFVMDAYGLRPRIEEMADRIADQGYVVLAPNVFYRSGPSPVLPMPDHTDPDSHREFMTAVRPLMNALTPEVTARDSAAFLGFLSDRATGPVGITGYCMGGRYGWRVAAAHPDRVAALGSFHGGGFVTDASDSPHRSADRLQSELYLGHADQDASMTPEQITELERALDDAGVMYCSEVYEGALHGYTMSDTAVYDEAAAERHFRELFALLERTLDRR